MPRKTVYVAAPLKLVGDRFLGWGWAARCLRRGAMLELRERGLEGEVSRVSAERSG